jgi:hypothetical protein
MPITLLRRRTLQTADNSEDKRNKNRQSKHSIKYYLDDVNRSRELLSYDSTTYTCLYMEQDRLVDSLHLSHLSIFYSIVSNIMSWPFFLGFVTASNDKEDEKYN